MFGTKSVNFARESRVDVDLGLFLQAIVYFTDIVTYLYYNVIDVMR